MAADKVKQQGLISGLLAGLAVSIITISAVVQVIPYWNRIIGFTVGIGWLIVAGWLYKHE